MLEALIAISTVRTASTAGDVIVLALPGRQWGTRERKRFVVVKWRDDALEAELQRRVNAGIRNPVIVYPYAVREAVRPSADPRMPIEQPRITTRSTRRVNMTSFPDPSIINDLTKDKPIYEITDYTTTTVTGGIFDTIKKVIVAAWNWMVA